MTPYYLKIKLEDLCPKIIIAQDYFLYHVCS